jgi:hypothetical protein
VPNHRENPPEIGANGDGDPKPKQEEELEHS